MKIKEEILGQYNHKDVRTIVMKTDSGMQVQLCSYGASIMKILLPDRQKTLKNVVLGYEDWHDYIDNPLYAGAVLCPNAGRISQGTLRVEGQAFKLSCNDGNHNLHGGFSNASYQVFDVIDIQNEPAFCSVTLYGTLTDGVDGFPGNRHIQIRYILRNDFSLEIDYLASADSTTYFNLSNHSYFNLSGDFTQSALLQELQMSAEQYVANDREHIPVSIEDCTGTPFDFSDFHSLMSNMEMAPNHPQLLNAHGYNHAFLLSVPSTLRHSKALKKALSLKDNASGRTLSIYTDAPSLVLYSGGYIGDSHLLHGNTPSSNSCAIALEAQDLPDTGNHFPQHAVFTHPGEEYRRTILYQF